MAYEQVDKFRLEFRRLVGALLRSWRESCFISIEDADCRLMKISRQSVDEIERGVCFVGNKEIFLLTAMYKKDLIEFQKEIIKINRELLDRGIRPPTINKPI